VLLMSRFLHISLLSLLLLGCVKTGVQSGMGAQQAGSALPAWILNPDKPGFQSVVGSAAVQDWGGRAAQYRVAEMKARQELAHMIRVQVKSTNRLQEELRDGKLTRDADIETQLQSSVEMSLASARVIEEWIDPQSGVLYIWMITSK
jgi:hypothetical protein